jgi:hypothetical protein
MTTVFEINNAGQVIVGGTLVGAREIGTVQAAETRLPSYTPSWSIWWISLKFPVFVRPTAAVASGWQQ